MLHPHLTKGRHYQDRARKPIHTCNKPEPRRSRMTGRAGPGTSDELSRETECTRRGIGRVQRQRVATAAQFPTDRAASAEHDVQAEIAERQRAAAVQQKAELGGQASEFRIGQTMADRTRDLRRLRRDGRIGAEQR